MKERPIIFNTEMVKAILEGRKTQTRRVIKPQPGYDLGYQDCGNGFAIQVGADYPDNKEDERYCPYGQAGDKLWVREAFVQCISTKIHPGPNFVYRADTSKEAQEDYGYKWKPSIHMPRLASRITLEITDIRVERVQDITLQDKWNEGYPPEIGRFQDLWDSINEKRGFGWDTNPWVWVIEFKRI